VPRQVIQRIHLARAPGDHTKTSGPQFAGQSLEVLDLEFDLDFERRGHSEEQYIESSVCNPKRKTKTKTHHGGTETRRNQSQGKLAADLADER
jgi:hypothetical protein